MALGCGEDGFVAAVDQFGEAGLVAQVGAQYQGVGEEADHWFDLGAGPAGEDRADGEVVLAGVVVEHGQQPGLQHGEEGDLVVRA